MLVIHPDECIDCGVCEPECPVEAIVPDTDAKAQAFAEINSEFSKQWPKISEKKSAPADADQWEDVPNKFPEHFSPKPGNLIVS
jgi:ferredoxin